MTILGIMAATTMNRSGYDVRLAAGTITAGGTLGILIPPSIMLVVMGPVLEIPVTDLFAAAIIPGIMMAVLYLVYSVGRCWIDPSLGPPLPEDMIPDDKGDVLARVLPRPGAADHPDRLRAGVDPDGLGHTDRRCRYGRLRFTRADTRLTASSPVKHL